MCSALAASFWRRNDLHGLKPGSFPFQVHAGTGPACLGAVTDALALDPTIRAPTRSACERCPHARHSNSDWLLRLVFSQCPHSGQVRLVLRGSTATTGTPAIAALYSTNSRNWKKAQPESRLRCSPPLAETRSRIPSRFSRPIPRPVPLAVSTIFLAMDTELVGLVASKAFGGDPIASLVEPFDDRAERPRLFGVRQELDLDSEFHDLSIVDFVQTIETG